MAIFADKNTRLLVQGITGREGLFHTQQMIAYGTNVVGGVTPGKGGEWAEGKPVFDTVKEGRESTGANATIIFVPARFAPDSMYEAIDAGMELIVCITEGIPVGDMMKVREHLDLSDSRLIRCEVIRMVQAVERERLDHVGAERVHRRPRRRDLIDDGDAVAPLIDHALDTARLPFDPLQPLLELIPALLIELGDTGRHLLPPS